MASVRYERWKGTLSKTLFSLAAAATLSLGLGAAGASTVNMPDKDSYQWSATLVSYDPAAGTAVLREHIEPYPGIRNLDGLVAGERMILIWSGRMWASGVRSLEKNPKLEPESLSLPVEYVGTERDGDYLDFRIAVPGPARELLGSLPAGARISGVSPRMAHEWGTGVISLKPYNQVG